MSGRGKRAAGVGAVAVMCLACAIGVASAQSAERLQPDFTFKRVAVPQAGARQRITVQIVPKPPRKALPPAASGDAPASGSQAGQNHSGFEWFWASVSPRMSDSGPGRLETALGALDAAPQGKGLAAPRVQQLQDIARLHGTDIMMATVGTKVSPALALAVIAVESAGRSDATSHAGAQGLMQLMPATAARFGVADRKIAPENIRGGVAYLDWLMGHFNRDPILVLAGYNAGEGSVRDNAGVPPYAETRGYVPKVLSAWRVARGLCITPPVLISDGCVFSINNL